MLYIQGMNNEEFSIENHLKKLRKERSVSQEELAKALGLSRQSVISIEQGRSMPSLPVVISLCKFLILHLKICLILKKK